jgi:transposase-like protein
MPAERMPMRQVREILRLTFSGDVAGREIARRLGIAPSTVRAAVERFRSSGPSCSKAALA